MIPPDGTPRLRMFAGPNGSGKSTLKFKFEAKFKRHLGVFVNPDEIETKIRTLDLKYYHVEADLPGIVKYFKESTLLKKSNLLAEIPQLSFSQNKLGFGSIQVNSY